MSPNTCLIKTILTQSNNLPAQANNKTKNPNKTKYKTWSNEEEFLPGAVTCLAGPTRAIQTLPRRGGTQWAHMKIGVLDYQQWEWCSWKEVVRMLWRERSQQAHMKKGVLDNQQQGGRKCTNLASSIVKDLIDSEDPKNTLFCREIAFVVIFALFQR